MTVVEPHVSPLPPVLLGVVGAPAVVANSLSPAMFAAAFEARGRVAYYVPLAIRERAARKALRGLARLGFAGANVTMPYKAIAAEMAHTRSALVEQTGVANTLRIDSSGQVHAEATDGLAMAAAVRAAGRDLAGATVTVLGSGGAATEAAYACGAAGARKLRLWNRTPERALALIERLRASYPQLVLELSEELPIDVPADVFVSAVPAAALAPQAFVSPIAGGSTLVVDFAYRADRQPTPLIEVAQRHSQDAVDGRELLVRQAAEAYRVWFDDDPPVEEMSRAVA
jgi:shikimate dehydrogenase